MVQLFEAFCRFFFFCIKTGVLRKFYAQKVSDSKNLIDRSNKRLCEGIFFRRKALLTAAFRIVQISFRSVIVMSNKFQDLPHHHNKR